MEQPTNLNEQQLNEWLLTEKLLIQLQSLITVGGVCRTYSQGS